MASPMLLTAVGWPGLESDSSKPRCFLRYARSSPGHPSDGTPLFKANVFYVPSPPW